MKSSILRRWFCASSFKSCAKLSKQYLKRRLYILQGSLSQWDLQTELIHYCKRSRIRLCWHKVPCWEEAGYATGAPAHQSSEEYTGHICMDPCTHRHEDSSHLAGWREVNPVQELYCLVSTGPINSGTVWQ